MYVGSMKRIEVDFDNLLEDVRSGEYDFVEITENAPRGDAAQRHWIIDGEIGSTYMVLRPMGGGPFIKDNEKIEAKFKRFREKGIWSMTTFVLKQPSMPLNSGNIVKSAIHLLRRPIIGVLLLFERPFE